jgi:ketosteroid isomerase-like protein
VTEIRDHEPAAGPASSTSVTDRELAIVRAGYELWNSGDIAGLADRYFDEQIEYHNSPEWPGQRVYRGSEAVARFLKEEVADVIGLEPVEIQRMEVIGEEIVIALQAPTRAAQSGLDFGSGPVFHVARVRDDRVVRVRVYLDERQALEAARTAGD